MNGIIRPSLEEVYGLLREKNALIVHFSGAPKGFGKYRPDNLFPKDLLHAIAVHDIGGQSCSVVMPGDNFSGEGRNAVGCIGLVLALKSPNSLEDASFEDLGSVEDQNGLRRTSFKEYISFQDLRNSIEYRPSNSYNEWVINYYDDQRQFKFPFSDN